jgi:4-amino-4-deoxy-L-arabinose transferase-like glycosyltransferase
MTWRLSPFSLAVISVFGLSLLLIHLGDRRVLTRHEALAAQPGREMLHDADLREWILPTLAGVHREAKPPGMMWLVALSIYVFRDESEFFARLPSALAGFAVAIMMARLAARWFGNIIGRLAGLVQLTSVYLLMQAKLAEADMALAGCVCAALYLLATGVIDSPSGLATSRSRRIGFWLAITAAFLLKGPIGPLFVAMTLISFAFLTRNWRTVHFIAEPAGIGLCLLLVILWPLAAWRIDPSIIRVWNHQVIGAATGKLGSDPIYYYVLSVPLMLLPWTPLTVLGLMRGPNAELAGPLVRQSDRAMIWKFLLCWFVMGFLFLSLALKIKSNHYTVPVLPALTIPTAVGLEYYVRRQCGRAQAFIWPYFLGACAVAALVIWELHSIDRAIKPGIVMLIGLLAAGGLASLYFEKAQRPRLVLISYFLTAWAIGVGVQSWLMPAQDDFAYQAHFAVEANAMVPPGDVIYMLGHREEEQEAEYAYYLRFPMRRLESAADFAEIVSGAGDGPVYAIAPAGFLPELSGAGAIQTLAECKNLRKGETESNRLCLLRVTRNLSTSTDKS